MPMTFLEKLRNLSETKKIIIFFTVMGVCAFIGGFIFVRSANKTIQSVSQNSAPLSLPSIEFPDINMGNVSESDQPVLTPN